jgi:hypothetical protein
MDRIYHNMPEHKTDITDRAREMVRRVRTDLLEDAIAAAEAALQRERDEAEGWISIMDRGPLIADKFLFCNPGCAPFIATWTGSDITDQDGDTCNAMYWRYLPEPPK